MKGGKAGEKVVFVDLILSLSVAKKEKEICVMKNKKLLLLNIVLTVILIAGMAAFAQNDYPDPDQTIEIIVPYAAGGGSDTLTRVSMKYFDISSPIAVVNISGAASAIGTMEAYNSEADGYTLLCHNAENLVDGYLVGTIPAPVFEDLEPLACVVDDPYVIVAPKDSKFKTWEEFVAYAKENPGIMSYASGDLGGLLALNSTKLFQEVGIKVNIVPTQGGANTRTAVAGSHVDAGILNVSEAKDMIEAGDFIPLLVSSQERSKYLPDVPSAGDVGSSVNYRIHRGFFAPPGTHQEIVKIWEEELKKMNQDPEFVKEIEDTFQFNTSFLSAQETKNLLNEMYPKWKAFMEEVEAAQ
jgi:tripartite-type tricarboxylate transporter receptor subunit TctC